MSKFASKGDSADSMELLQTNSANHASHTVGIAHTRWATHGEREIWLMYIQRRVGVRSGRRGVSGDIENGGGLSQQFDWFMCWALLPWPKVGQKKLRTPLPIQGRTAEAMVWKVPVFPD